MWPDILSTIPLTRLTYDSSLFETHIYFKNILYKTMVNVEKEFKLGFFGQDPFVIPFISSSHPSLGLRRRVINRVKPVEGI